VNRRELLLGLVLSIPVLAEDAQTSLRGKLTKGPNGTPALKTADGKLIFLEGDKSTTGVLNDKRLAGDDFELIGHFVAPDRFRVGPIYKKSMFVHKDGKKFMITYWCDVCSIRTYTPGPCWCCQRETALDLREVDQP
jgi:hypothetical protein